MEIAITALCGLDCVNVSQGLSMNHENFLEEAKA